MRSVPTHAYSPDADSSTFVKYKTPLSTRAPIGSGLSSLRWKLNRMSSASGPGKKRCALIYKSLKKRKVIQKK